MRKLLLCLVLTSCGGGVIVDPIELHKYDCLCNVNGGVKEYAIEEFVQGYKTTAIRCNNKAVFYITPIGTAPTQACK